MSFTATDKEVHTPTYDLRMRTFNRHDRSRKVLISLDIFCSYILNITFSFNFKFIESVLENTKKFIKNFGNH